MSGKNINGNTVNVTVFMPFNLKPFYHKISLFYFGHLPCFLNPNISFKTKNSVTAKPFA